MSMWIVYSFILIVAATDGTLAQGNCQRKNLKLEKVVGIQPTESHKRLLLLKGTGQNPITVQCIEKCLSMDDCLSFVIHFDVNICYWFQIPIQGVKAIDNEINPLVAWFRKVCLITDPSCEKLWVFERIPGAVLIGNDTKRLPHLLTRLQCQQACLDETSFACRSAKFRIMNTYGLKDSVLGLCTLSSSDRHIMSSAFRVSNFNEEYFENECSKTIVENLKEFCSYEEYPNSTLASNDLLLANLSKDQCQQECEELQTFNCRGFSVVPTGPTFNCFLHSEDSKIHGPRLVNGNVLGTYFEKVNCINLTIICTETYMTVTYTPQMDFNGRMYMDGYSEQPLCFAKGEGTVQVALKLPVMSEQCGVVRAVAPDDRIFVTGSMIIQYNPLVQTQGDRTIRIGCIYGNESNNLLVGTGITITTGPNKGSPLLNSSGIISPTVEMRVLDLASQKEVVNTELGEDLQLVIEVKPLHGLDIWANHLVAMTEKSEESILLLDNSGCPTNPAIFPVLTKTTTQDSIRLEGVFKAFRFSSSPVVRFSVIVQFCQQNCSEPNCQSTRRKREARSLIFQAGTSITALNRSQFEADSEVLKMPLEYVMLVKKYPNNAEKLILGDAKVLIAGYDYTTNEVCLDYSLFIGLIILWILTQIIFVTCCLVLVRRYKRLYIRENATQSMENLHKHWDGYNNSYYDSRRVRWADNGEAL